jgi:hypothetical protein
MNSPTFDPVHLLKAATGIVGLDAITEGGLPAGRPTLLCGAAGSGKTLFGVTFLVEGALRFEEPGVLISFEESPADISANVGSLGYNLPSLIASKKLVVDQVKIERGETEESGAYDLEGLFVRLGMRSTESGPNGSSSTQSKTYSRDYPIQQSCAVSSAVCSPGLRKRASRQSSPANAAKVN